MFAIGDLTRVSLASGLPLPRAGLLAELQGRRVVAAVRRRSGRARTPAVRRPGLLLYIEVGAELAGVVPGDFYPRPPVVTVGGVSADNAAGKRASESARLARWFGA